MCLSLRRLEYFLMSKKDRERTQEHVQQCGDCGGTAWVEEEDGIEGITGDREKRVTVNMTQAEIEAGCGRRM